MNYKTFIDATAARAEVSPEDAQVLTRAVLETLADRLTAGEALDLSTQLPKPLQPPLQPRMETAARFPRAEFTRRVMERAGIEDAAATTAIRAVFATLREAVTGGEFEDMVAQLPADFADLTAPVAVRPGRRR